MRVQLDGSWPKHYRDEISRRIALHDTRHPGPDLDDHAGALMPKYRWSPERRPGPPREGVA